MAEIIYSLLLNTEGVIKLSSEELSCLNRQFTDLNESENKILNIAKLGIITGYTDKSFRANAYLNRAESVTVILRIIDKSYRRPIEIKQEDITAVDKLPEPKVSVVFNPTKTSLLKINIDNVNDYIPEGKLWTTAEFKIEFPDLPELYYVQSISSITGQKIILQAADKWEQLDESSNYVYLMKKAKYTTQENKEKIAKLLVNGYKLKYKISVRETINGVEVIKTVEDSIILNYEGSLSTDW